jgi:5-methylcytosine-specific restriction enzyme A
MTDSRTFSKQTKRLAWKRCGGRCEAQGCDTRFLPFATACHYDHRIPFAISEDSSLDNCQILCVQCHQKKTGTQDIPVIAKVKRISDSRIGIKRPGKKLPGGRDSGISKKLNGEVVRRPARGEKHRALMTKLYGDEA